MLAVLVCACMCVCVRLAFFFVVGVHEGGENRVLQVIFSLSILLTQSQKTSLFGNIFCDHVHDRNTSHDETPNDGWKEGKGHQEWSEGKGDWLGLCTLPWVMFLSDFKTSLAEERNGSRLKSPKISSGSVASVCLFIALFFAEKGADLLERQRVKNSSHHSPRKGMLATDRHAPA